MMTNPDTPTRTLPEPETTAVTVLLPCDKCGGRGELFYTHTTDKPLPCYGCDAGKRTVTATLTGREALVYRLGLAAAEWEKHRRNPFATEHQHRYHLAIAALSAFDAAQEAHNG